MAALTSDSLCAIIALRLYYLHEAFSSHANFTFSMTNSVITTQSALHFAVIAASFAYLKPFLSFFDSGLGATVKLDTVNLNSYPRQHSKTGGSGYAVKSSGGRSGRVISTVEPEKGGENVRTSSQDSKTPIIMKTQTYEVRYEPSSGM
jgi:hypothetical protein